MEMMNQAIQNMWQSIQELHLKLDHINANTNGVVQGPMGPSPYDIQELEQRVQEAESAKERYAQRCADAEDSLTKTLNELKHLQEKESRFRTIILDKTGNQQMSDNEIITAFVNVRQRSQGIIKAAYFGNMQINKSKLGDLHKDGSKAQFYHSLEGLKRKDRMLRARARMFRMLLAHILDANWFGLIGVDVQTKDGKALDRGIENALADLEDVLKDRKVPAATIADWRIETLNCVSQIATGDVKPVKRTIELILATFEPLISPEITPEAHEALKSDVAQLCADAYDLRMMMRRSKEEYAIWTPSPRGTQPARASDFTDFADSFEVEDGKAETGSDDIAYTLFGGLTKHPEYRGEGLCVLEKAQVVLHKIAK